MQRWAGRREGRKANWPGPPGGPAAESPPSQPSSCKKTIRKGRREGNISFGVLGPAYILLPQTYNYSCAQDNFAPSHHVGRRQRFGFAYLRNARSAQFIWVPIFLCTIPPLPGHPHLLHVDCGQTDETEMNGIGNKNGEREGGGQDKVARLQDRKTRSFRPTLA